MSEELVAISHEFSPLKANLIRSRLEADGIECFLAGETLTSVVGSLSYASASWQHPEGNIAIQVRASDAEAAKAILQEIETVVADEVEEERYEIFLNRQQSLVWQLFRVLLIVCLTLVVGVFAYWAIQHWLPYVITEALAFFGIRDVVVSF